MLLFKIAYWLGLVGQIIIRAPYQKTAKEGQKTDRRVSRTESALLALLAVFGFLIPAIYTFSSWLAFADYTLPEWLGWLGIPVLAASLFVFWRSHTDLKANWSPSLEIRADHSLVTNGIYRLIRHPMYASQFLFAIAQSLLLQNWLAGPTNLLFFTAFYLLRKGPEEQMMLDTFGEEYRAYMQRSGGVIPRLR